MLSSDSHIPQNESIRLFLKGFIDYAGLFPPASLSLSDAINAYASYRKGPDAWILGPFVCPVGRLDELDAISDVFKTDPPFRFSLLTRAVSSANAFAGGFDRDLHDIGSFCNRYAGLVQIDMLEVRLPYDAGISADTSREIVDTIQSSMNPFQAYLDTAYLEVERSERFSSNLESVCCTISHESLEPLNIGLKIRCGGMVESDYPSPREIATFLKTVNRYKLRFKATAGLHHPVRHYNEAAAVHMHGFLNVFFAAVIDAVHDLDLDQIEEIISDEDPSSFQFRDKDLSWKSLSISRAQLSESRSHGAISVGSCSFDEPREDLTKLNWLTPVSVST